MKFSDSHEWVKVKEGVATVGITAHAQKELGEIVYIDLPSLGKKVKAKQEAAILESTKAAADIYSPVSGEVVEINQNLHQFSDKINTSPEDEGWLFKVKLSHPEELDTLMNKEEYLQLIR
jgi:glycine cleavage system H protein